MELFYSPGTCSLAPHIALAEADAQFKLNLVDLKKRAQKEPAYLEINPKGSVPALKTSSGEIITEVAVLLQYIADQKPEKKLIPPVSTMERIRTQEWLNYISSEVHKALGAYFGLSAFENEQTKADLRTVWDANLKRKMNFISTQLEKSEYLGGSQFTIPDAYLFTVLNWTNSIRFDLTPWPAITKFMDRMKARPAVQRAMKEEGLL